MDITTFIFSYWASIAALAAAIAHTGTNDLLLAYEVYYGS